MDGHGAADLESRLTPRAKALFAKGKGQVRGHVLMAEPGGKIDLVHWSKAPRVANPGAPVSDDNPNRWNPKVIQQNIPVPHEVHEQMLASIPRQVSRTPSTRYQILVKQLVDECRKSKARHGKVIFPRSIEEEINKLAWMNGQLDLRARIENLEVDAIEAYADWLTRRASGQQRRMDFKKSALDHPGHYSA